MKPSQNIFKSLVKFENERELVFTVANPSQCNDFRHLIGQEVEINGKLYKVNGVHRHLHAPPWREGESIGLLVEAA